MNISKEESIFLIVHSICELILRPVLHFFWRVELKPACILLLVVYGCLYFNIPRFITFAEPALLDPCLQSKTLARTSY